MFSIHNHLLLQIFLGALSFVYFAKALSGSYLKSTITQIERRFDIPSSLVGLIDGSFEIGMWHRQAFSPYALQMINRPDINKFPCSDAPALMQVMLHPLVEFGLLKVSSGYCPWVSLSSRYRSIQIYARDIPDELIHVVWAQHTARISIADPALIPGPIHRPPFAITAHACRYLFWQVNIPEIASALKKAPAFP